MDVSKFRTRVAIHGKGPHVMKHLNQHMRSLMAGGLASIAMFSSASDAPHGLVEKSVEAAVRSSVGVRTSGASIVIPRECHYRDHEVQILAEEPKGTFKPGATGDSTSFKVTIGRDQISQSERTVVLVLVAFKSAADGPNLYLKARLSVRMSCDGGNTDATPQPRDGGT